MPINANTAGMPGTSFTGSSTKKNRRLQRLKQKLHARSANIFISLLVPLVVFFTSEWTARGSLQDNLQGTGFFQALGSHFASFFFGFLFLVFIYVIVSQLTGLHPLATILVEIIAFIPSVANYYKLIMRDEPLLPWDFNQIEDLLSIQNEVSLVIPPRIIFFIVIYLVLFALSFFIKTPKKDNKHDWMFRLISAGGSFVLLLFLTFGVYFTASGNKLAGIQPDSWMQDRYYRNHGVITAFMTNLQLLQIDTPKGYDVQAVEKIAAEIEQNSSPNKPLFSNSYAALTDPKDIEQTPDIIYIMGESFWDVTDLEGIEYDQEITPNLSKLKETAAYGYNFSPSYGGGTCDVEFEALTGFSMDHLPSGSKPYQQYLTSEIFSLPNYLKNAKDYETLAIHPFGRQFWNRDDAYPNLGIDTFYSQEDFINPDKKRGYVSDDAMIDRIIEECEARSQSDPFFLHAVSMQNHTTYDAADYLDEQRVKVTKAPQGVSGKVLGELESCATGIRDMDAALGNLVSHLQTSSRPTILVFWGDHMNPMSNGTKLFEDTGYIQDPDEANPQLRQTPLLIWSNYSDQKIDLGIMSSYNISPVVMDLYGLEKPVMFDYLAEQYRTLHGRTRGITVETNNTYQESLTDEQRNYFQKHAILQYDYMFTTPKLETYTTK